jgi:hypothetical protein
MALLPSRDARRVLHLFESEHLALVLDAVVAGNSPARVWADDFMAPRTALIWDGAHSVYLAGAVDEAKVWRELFDREIAPLTRGLLKAYAQHHVETVFAGYPFQPRERVLYRGVLPPIPDWRRRIRAGFHISAINERVTELRRFANGADIIAEIESCWIAADFRRTGFGFVAHDTETIVC